jgi:hypothetical protein
MSTTHNRGMVPSKVLFNIYTTDLGLGHAQFYHGLEEEPELLHEAGTAYSAINRCSKSRWLMFSSSSNALSISSTYGWIFTLVIRSASECSSASMFHDHPLLQGPWTSPRSHGSWTGGRRRYDVLRLDEDTIVGKFGELRAERYEELLTMCVWCGVCV